MRLKFGSLSLLDHQNMPKPIPHCSNFIKIIFLKKGPSNNLSPNSYLMSKPNVGLLHWNLSGAFTFIILLTRRRVDGCHDSWSELPHYRSQQTNSSLIRFITVMKKCHVLTLDNDNKKLCVHINSTFDNNKESWEFLNWTTPTFFRIISELSWFRMHLD